MRKDYQGDLLEFEKQMKLRLQCAVFPQMIAHEFPISQQKPNPHAADLLELYAPLFEPSSASGRSCCPIAWRRPATTM